MANAQEPDQKPADNEPDSIHRESVSLVDLFDQMDRDSFRRSLELRDNVKRPLTSEG